MCVHFKFKFDSENFSESNLNLKCNYDHGVLTIFLNDSGSTECKRLCLAQTVQITPMVEFTSGKSMHNQHS